MKRGVFCWVLIVAVSVAGCGGDDKNGGKGSGGNGSGNKTPKDAASADREAFPESQATAVVSGKVVFDGDPPPREAIPAETIAKSKDTCCIKHHADSPVLSEELIVGDNKGIRNVVVFVKRFPDKWAFSTPDETVVIDQIGCTYVPHVVGVMVGQPVEVTSSDDTTHNVHFMATKNRIRKSNSTIPKGGKVEVSFKRPELGSAYFKCDIHGWMKSYVGIFDHPFFIVTGDDGAYELPKLPPGEYEISAWHEKLGTQTQTITVKDGESAAVDFRW